MVARHLPVRGAGGHDARAVLRALPPHLRPQAEGGPLAGAGAAGAGDVLGGVHHAHHRALRTRSQESIHSHITRTISCWLLAMYDPTKCNK